MSFWSLLKTLGQSFAICREKCHTLKGVNYVNFVFDCGSSGVTCPADTVLVYSFMFLFSESLWSWQAGTCRNSVAFVGLGVPWRTDWLFRMSPFPEPNPVPGTELNLNKTF